MTGLYVKTHEVLGGYIVYTMNVIIMKNNKIKTTTTKKKTKTKQNKTKCKNITQLEQLIIVQMIIRTR
jgi:hypothetical protein